jgi:hypothetical protein
LAAFRNFGGFSGKSSGALLRNAVSGFGAVRRFEIMKKQIHYEDQLVVRIARPLRAELESAAQDDGRVLSNQIRKILIDFAATRVLDRETGEGKNQ